MTDELQRKRELNDGARELLDNKAFDAAILSLRKRWFDQLLIADGIEKVVEYRAMIKALEAIPAELTVIMNDWKMANRQQQRHG
jgi:sulfur transfer complex TusBCD TusB component (DsrH family)